MNVSWWVATLMFSNFITMCTTILLLKMGIDINESRIKLLHVRAKEIAESNRKDEEVEKREKIL